MAEPGRVNVKMHELIREWTAKYLEQRARFEELRSQSLAILDEADRRIDRTYHFLATSFSALPRPNASPELSAELDG